MAGKKARSLRHVKLYVDRTEESGKVARLLADDESRILLFKHGIEVAHIPVENRGGPELHDGKDIRYGFEEIKDWLEGLKEK